MHNPSLQLNSPVYNLPSTLVLSVVIFMVFFASQLMGVVLFAPWILPNAASLDLATTITMGSENGTVMSLALGFTLLMVVGCVGVFIQKKSSNIKDYLAIRWFSRQHLLIGVMWLLILNVLINAVTVWLDREPMLFMDGLAQSAQPLWLLVIAMVIFAPVYEEVMFRGFLWTGLASSRLGVWGASLISSLVFALIHLQYGVVEWMGVFCLAVVFSYARLLSGSLLLPMLLHMLNNGLAMWQYLGNS